VLLGSRQGKDQAVKENIEAALDELLKKKMTKHDLLLLAYSGHGQQFTPHGEKEEVPFYCPVGAAIGRTDTLVSLAGWRTNRRTWGRAAQNRSAAARC
jgi:hypothetical protein